MTGAFNWRSLGLASVSCCQSPNNIEEGLQGFSVLHLFSPTRSSSYAALQSAKVLMQRTAQKLGFHIDPSGEREHSPVRLRT